MSRPVEGALDALARLARSVDQVAIVTGRPALVATELTGVTGHPGLGRLVVLGHYGLERWDAATGKVTSDPVPAGVAEARDRLPGLLQELGLPDAFVEDKESSLAVHTRRLPDPVGAFERLRTPLTELAESTELRLEPGNLVLELRPPGIDKGVALRRLIESTGARSILYAGDDLGDLAAFRAIEEQRKARPARRTAGHPLVERDRTDRRRGHRGGRPDRRGDRAHGPFGRDRSALNVCVRV